MRASVRALGAAAVALTAACGSSDETATTCFRASGAEVCAVRSTGAVRISADGLLPGSDLLVDRPGADPMVLEVGADGRPVGANGLLGVTESGPLVLAVSGTAADGRAIDGQIVSEPA